MAHDVSDSLGTSGQTLTRCGSAGYTHNVGRRLGPSRVCLCGACFLALFSVHTGLLNVKTKMVRHFG
jgi:hypothetical protein